jgi:hypothetical protein
MFFGDDYTRISLVVRKLDSMSRMHLLLLNSLWVYKKNHIEGKTRNGRKEFIRTYKHSNINVIATQKCFGLVKKDSFMSLEMR